MPRFKPYDKWVEEKEGETDVEASWEKERKVLLGNKEEDDTNGEDTEETSEEGDKEGGEEGGEESTEQGDTEASRPHSEGE